MDELAVNAAVWKPAGQPMKPDPLTFDEFFVQESDTLLRLLCVILGSRSQAEDVAQEALTKVFERWDRVAAMDNPAGYLFTVAMNQARSEHRKAARTLKRLVRSTPANDDVFALVEDRDEALQALAVLTPRQRAALVLTEALGYSGEEAATLLGIKASTVYALTHQARTTLAQHVEATP